MLAALVEPAGAGRRHPAEANLVIWHVICILLRDKPTLNRSLPVRCRTLIDRPRRLNRSRYLAVERRCLLIISVANVVVVARCKE